MQVAIDIGNTFLKAACFEGNRLLRHISLRADAALECTLATWLAKLSVTRVGLCSVVPDLTHRICSILTAHESVSILHIDHTLKLPFTIRYKPQRRLGADRIAAATGARLLYSSQNVVVIDAGTAVTIDTLRADGVFLGGSIAPGPELLRAALTSGTASLPTVQLELPDGELGTSTVEAIQHGLMYGMLDHINGALSRMRLVLADDFVVVLTGGWHKLVATHVPDIDHVDQHLVLRGICGLMVLNPPAA